EGSCVTINCTYELQNGMEVFWIKDSKWNVNESKFNGTVVFSNTEKRTQAPEYFDRVEFLHDNSSYGNAKCSLKIKHLRKNDSGAYAFRFIKKTYKFKSEEFNLKVTDNKCKVHIKPPNLNMSLKDGDNLILQCATSVDCKFFPEWQSSVKVLSMRNIEENEKLSELNLTVSWRDDGKTLTCRSSGSFNDNCLEKNYTLSVEYAPQETVVIQSSDLNNIKEKENVTVSCTSKAKPEAEFTWFKHDSSFSQPGENLTLYNMKPEDKGIFYCQAKNIHGDNKSPNIPFNIIYAPKGVTIKSESIILKERSRLTLTCSVENSNPAVEEEAYRWYKNNKEIEAQTKKIFTVPWVKRPDAGHYQCQARNSAGETNSTHPIQIYVKFLPQNTKISGMTETKLGFKLNLQCVTEADPDPINYYWYFKPEHDKFFHTISNQHQEYLEIEKVAVTNTGSYKCSAENSLGTGANSTEFSVLVLYPPKKPNLTMKQVVNETESYSITCTVESSPQASLTLSISSLSNPKTNRILHTTFQSNFLTFSATAKVSDAGEYTCIAKNTQGENSSENRLIVWYAPKNVTIEAHPGKELKEGSNLTLTCTADCVPRVNAYTWEKSNRTHSVRVGHEQTLRLHFLKPSDSDHYVCITKNDIGMLKSSALYIRVNYRPRITIIHNMTSMGLLEDAVPVHLSCSAQCDPPATFFAWYMLEKNTTVLTNHQNYTVQPHNPGTYYCIARNGIGESSSQTVKIYLNLLDFRSLSFLVYLHIYLFCMCLCILSSYRIIKKKRHSGKNESPQQLFFFSKAPFWPSSNFCSSGSRNNTRETLVIEESDELSGFRDNHSSDIVHSHPPPNRKNPNSNIHTVYDAIHLPPTITECHYTAEDLPIATLNYATLQFADSNIPNKSVPSSDSCGPVYAKVLKNGQMAKEQGKGHSDYENVSGVYKTKQPFPNWDSDTSESEEEVDYTKVTFTVTTHNNPKMDPLSIEEEDQTDYSEVKI
ncbi:B-cell receptor CD22 precursor, partial [Silurus meridionalis]